MYLLLSLGSNLSWAEAKQKMLDLQPHLSRLCPGVRFSSVYPTEGVGRYVGRYANCMAEGDTELPLAELEHSCKQLELSFGRTAEARRLGVVPIDIDIVCYGDKIVRPKNYDYDYMTPGIEELSKK